MDTERARAGVEEDHPRVIVGVVKDVKESRSDRNKPDCIHQLSAARLWLYPSWGLRPHSFAKTLYGAHVAPTATMAREMRKTVTESIPALPPSDPVTLESRCPDSWAYPRFMMQLVSVFAGFAVVLAAIGVYGTTFYLVGQRRHEMALRAAWARASWI